jgi:hypothetical protein
VGTLPIILKMTFDAPIRSTGIITTALPLLIATPDGKKECD